MNNLTLGSLFDGSGGFPLGGLISGITPVWASEVEPFPIRVTTKRMPDIKHYGDISTMNGAKIEPVDIITFGSPCQDMSIAGKRNGLDGNRSNLFYEAIRIIKEMRCATNGKYPRYIVWENVPGAYSSNHGEDFRCVLESICKVKNDCISVPRPNGKWAKAGNIVGDKFSLAWRTLDAQHWGVPQRRKRIYLVADFAGTGASKILFESEGVSGYSPQSLRAWQNATRCTGTSVETPSLCLNDQGGNRMDVTEDVTCTLRAESHHPPLVFENHSQDCRYKELGDVCQTVLSTFGTGGNNQPFVVGDTPKTLKIRSGCDGGGKGALIQDDKSATLGCNNDQTVFVPETYALQGSMIGRKTENGPQGDGINKDVSFTLNATDKHAVYSMTTGGFMQVNEEKAPTLASRDYKDPPCVNGSAYTVRRLTPTECARLQGFPDFWCSNLETESPTDEELKFWRGVFDTHARINGKKPKSDNQIVKWLKNPHSDSAEYKMWGNGVCLNNVVFVLSGIVYHFQESAE